MNWENAEARPLAVAELGEGYRRYRLADPAAEEAMARSLHQYGQLSPLTACWRDGRAELLDGFKRRTPRHGCADDAPKLLAPRVQHQQRAQPRSQVTRIGADRLQRLGGGREQPIVQELAVAQGQRAQFMRQGEHHVEVADRQQIATLPLQPRRPFRAAATGTVAIAARVVVIGYFTAVGTRQHVAPQRCRPA